MIYLILLILGLLIGAVFLVMLLIGDKKEARLIAQRKAQQEQAAQVARPVEGAWPPPPNVSAPPGLPPPTLTQNRASTRAETRKMMRTFFLVRNHTLGMVVLAYIIYSCFPHLGFGWVLLATMLTFGVVWGGMTLVKRKR